jgi:hypothetical protein
MEPRLWKHGQGSVFVHIGSMVLILQWESGHPHLFPFLIFTVELTWLCLFKYRYFRNACTARRTKP